MSNDQHTRKCLNNDKTSSINPAYFHRNSPLETVLATSSSNNGNATAASPVQFLTTSPNEKNPRKIRPHLENAQTPSITSQDTKTQSQEVSAFHDLIAGGCAGSISVIAGHPFDTIKVRLQTTSSGTSISSLMGNGIPSLFRGMAAPLSTAAIVNAMIFSSFGLSSRLWDEVEFKGREKPTIVNGDDFVDWKKNFVCGSFAGLVQCVVICPMEHIKCRLQLLRDCKTNAKAPSPKYQGSFHTMSNILSTHGLTTLYRGWWVTCLREVPAFGAYFAIYDLAKRQINSILRSYDPTHIHSWTACAVAGGISGTLTWAVIYPLDMIKTRIQTSPLVSEKPNQRHMWQVGKYILANHGWRYMFRGFGVTVLRAFPVNGIIFPVYEFTLMHLVGNGVDPILGI